MIRHLQWVPMRHVHKEGRIVSPWLTLVLKHDVRKASKVILLVPIVQATFTRFCDHVSEGRIKFLDQPVGLQVVS